MASPLRKVPLTPLDTLRTLTTGYSEADTGFGSHLSHLVQDLRRQALPELGKRLASPGTPKGFKRTILSLVPKFDWHEWVGFILPLLQQEADLGVFDDGCAALGSLGIREGYEALSTLRDQRKEADRQVILNRELSLYQPQQTFDYYLSRLMEGHGNQRLANQGGKMLAVLTGPAELPAILDAHRQGDALTQRLALRIITSVKAPAAAAYLLDLVSRSKEEYLDNQSILDVVQKVSSLPRPSAKQELVNQVKARFASRAPEGVSALAHSLSEEGVDPGHAMEAIRQEASGPFDGFLLEALNLVLEGKIARFTAYCSEQETVVEARQSQLLVLMDQSAEALAYKCSQGEVALENVLSVLGDVFRARVGAEGVLQAYLRLLPASDEQALAGILAEPDMTRRSRCLDALGSREDDAFTPFFLKAMQDPIVEVGERAIHHLGKLPSSYPALMAMFDSGHYEQVRLAIRVFGENHTRMAAESLLGFIQKDARDDILVEAVEALANISYTAGVPVYLDLLHDGKPHALQIALTKALSQLGLPEASLGLLQKAPMLKQPQVLILALEGALTGFPSFESPFPAGHLPALLQLVDRCCDDREGEGQRMRALMAMEDLYVFDKDAYERLKDRLSDFLFDMRTKEAWDRENNDRVAATIKELTRRCGALGLLARKESELRGLVAKIPEPGPRRADALLALRENLRDPELILRPEMAQELGVMIRGELQKKALEWRETAHLCEIAGIAKQADLAEPLREIYQRSTGLGLKSAARDALLRMGFSEEELNKRPPIRSILVLEPSAFFRKRLVSSLATAGTWQIFEAASRGEAGAILSSSPVDVLLSESQDAEGDLGHWLDGRWNTGACKYVILSSANRDLGELAGSAWLIGVLYKPYPMGQLIHLLES